MILATVTMAEPVTVERGEAEVDALLREEEEVEFCAKARSGRKAKSAWRSSTIVVPSSFEPWSWLGRGREGAGGRSWARLFHGGRSRKVEEGEGVAEEKEKEEASDTLPLSPLLSPALVFRRQFARRCNPSLLNSRPLAATSRRDAAPAPWQSTPASRRFAPNWRG
jgi:hypothetical protein